MTWVEKHYGRLEDQPGFDEFLHEYSAAIKEVDTKIEILSEDFAVRHDYNPIHHIEKSQVFITCCNLNDLSSMSGGKAWNVESGKFSEI